MTQPAPAPVSASRIASYEQTVDVETPELVTLTYSIAGLGSRALAALTDLALSVAILVAVMLTIAFLTRGAAHAGGPRMSDSWAFAILFLLQFAVLWGYYVLFEGLMDGQTPGKRIHRLRVVRDGGYSVTFGVSAARNLMRIVDMQPGIFYLAGIGSVLLTKHGRRLGDLVAGTLVVREEIRQDATSTLAVRERPGAATLQTTLTEDEFHVLDRFVERWSALEPLRRARLAEQLAARFAGSLPDDGRAAGPRLLDLHGREQRARARGVASRGEIGAGRERQALIAAGVPRWNAFAARLAAAQKGGLRTLGEDGVREFVAEYRVLAADLARLRTAARGRALDELFQLGRLVASAHNLLYRDRGMPLRATIRFLFSDVPREIRRSARPIALAALLLFGPALVAGVAVTREPTIAARLLPPAMLRRATDGVRRAREGEGYITDPGLLRPVMASTIVANNVQVTFAVFAGGITAGLIPLLVLVSNGISIGSVAGLYVSKGIGTLLLAFVAPHGVLELFAICVAGGGGFLIAAALLVPGARSRRRALVENGRRAVHLIGGSTLMLVVAGTLEGLVSPIEWWPLEGKLAVSATTLVLLIVYLREGRARRLVVDDGNASRELALGAVTARHAP